MLNRIIFLLFFLSGASSLILEVVWVKLFSLVFGNTVFAVSAVLSSFFFGLALGSYLLGHYSDRYKGKYLFLYGLIEVTIGAYALILPRLVPLIHFFYFPMIQGESAGFYELSLVRFLIAFLLLVVPTTLMGASLPVLTRYIVDEHDKLGTSLGRLYAFNTLGAMTGCMAAGFVLIAMLGVSGANLVAVSTSGVVGLTALYLSRSEKERVPEIHVREGVETKADSWSVLLLVAFALSGFCALAYEVVWVRVLATVFGPTTYSFSIMLTTFLAGIAIGSLAASRLADRWRSLVYTFGVMEIVVGLLAVGMLPLFREMPLWFGQLRVQTDYSWYSIISMEILVCFLLFFPPTFLFGATFPIVGKLYVRTIGKLGGATGKMYAVNTVGGIFGSALAGFILLPWLGVKFSILAVAGLNMAIGVVIVLRDTGAARKILTAAGACLAFAGLFAYFYSFPMIKGLNLLYYKEDVAASVVVEEYDGEVSVWLNGRKQGMTSAARASGTDPIKKVGHFPLLLHPDPDEVLMVGLGVGVSSGAVALHDVERVDVVEIVPSLVETLRFFKESTNDILHDPRYNFIIGDGRNFVASTEKSYDVIISDIYHPDVAGVGSLYAREYYEAVRKRLNPDGLYAQWVTLYQIGTNEVKSIVATMAEVFPHITVWDPDFNHPGGVLLVLGSKSDLSVSRDLVARRLEDEKIAEDLFEGDDAVINTDDHPFIEYSAPKNRWARRGPELSLENLKYIQEFANPVTPRLEEERKGLVEEVEKYYEVRKHLYRGEVLKAKGDHEGRLEEYLQAARVGVSDPYLRPALLETFMAIGKDAASRGDWMTSRRYRELYDTLRAADPSDDVEVLRALAAILARH